MAACETLTKTFSYHAEPRPKSEKSPHDATFFTSRYMVNEQLGQGAFGTVFSGVRIEDERPVAAKLIARSKVDKWSTVRFKHALMIAMLSCSSMATAYRVKSLSSYTAVSRTSKVLFSSSTGTSGTTRSLSSWSVRQFVRHASNAELFFSHRSLRICLIISVQEEH